MLDRRLGSSRTEFARLFDRTLMAVSVSIQRQAGSRGSSACRRRVRRQLGANADHSRFVVVDAPQRTAETFRVLTNWQGGSSFDWQFEFSNG
jgi:hypothetical protein